ncbi:MAG TPA: glycolate oxidase subunit GlcE [Porticoccaceae bacterium]|nr:glycolate oxidase subunit GlcE [Porticoccaceae bacterium]
MPEVYYPDQSKQLIDLVQWANAHKTPLAVRGGNSKAGVGRPVAAEHIVDMSRLNGVRDYNPVELVLTAGAGTPLEDIEKVLADKGQMLAFEPPAYALNEAADGRTTLGGVLAANASGPRRFYSGAARDHFLGFKAVNGRGEAFKSGGQVVKNVTGFDVSKLMAGSWGTLAILYEVTLKVIPAAKKTRTLLVFGQNPEHARRTLTAAASSPHGVSGAAYLAGDLARRSGVSLINEMQDNTPVTALRIEGPAESLEHRLKALTTVVCNSYATSATTVELPSSHSQTLWREIGNLSLLKGSGQPILWRLSLPPGEMSTTLHRLQALGIDNWQVDQAGGAVWLACGATVSADKIRNALGRSRGHATLWQAPASMRAEVDVFQPQSAALKSLTRRVKNSFDPNGILNPRRMYRDI